MFDLHPISRSLRFLATCQRSYGDTGRHPDMYKAPKQPKHKNYENRHSDMRIWNFQDTKLANGLEAPKWADPILQ